MPRNTETRTRKDWLRQEVYSDDLVGDIAEDMGSDKAEDLASERIEAMLTRENELMWAWSRDPMSDLTQIEARDRAQSFDYGRYNLSQSSVSRKLSTLDEKMFTEPIERLGMAEPLFSEAWYDDVSKVPDLLGFYENVVARFLCDMHALRQLESSTKPTPEWVLERFPEANPNLGRKLGKRARYNKVSDMELHEQQEWTQEPPTADD